ncbi:hypothetical protein [Sorangium sp. So ce145]|uniref:hypothetical protein n=1 Tax=Sorangium sp. So ce145 TaxID=3133285 RepID=UPI003F5EE5F2
MLRLAEEDLSATADETSVLDGFPGVRPWDMATLWGAVLDLGVRARRASDRERFQQALGALDVLERKYGAAGQEPGPSKFRRSRQTAHTF